MLSWEGLKSNDKFAILEENLFGNFCYILGDRGFPSKDCMF